VSAAVVRESAVPNPINHTKGALLDSQTKELKLQIAVLETLVGALIRTVVKTPDLKDELKEHLDDLIDSVENSPPGSLAEYSNEERLEISARIVEYAGPLVRT
jgi:uncharacterized coiled-coil protein SlyX